MTAVQSPFGGDARHLLALPSRSLIDAYRDKCGLDVSPWLQGLAQIDLYECALTGMRFWRPASTAGDEAFYRALSAVWPNYYRTDRWEYAAARAWLGGQDPVLEVGCGRGWFLKSLEGDTARATGLELNREAIASTVTRFATRAEMIADHAAAHPAAYAAVCSFQVLEHVADPAAFLRGCLQALRPGGLLILSTPNHAAAKFALRQDAFDLPPHHLNHFDAAAYRRLAAVLGLSVHGLRQQPRSYETRQSAGSASPIWDRVWGKAATVWYRLTGSPGDSLVVALRK